MWLFMQVLLWMITTAGFLGYEYELLYHVKAASLAWFFFQWEHNDTWEDFPHTADQWSYFPRKWCASIYLCQWTQGFWCPFSCLIENWFCEMASFFIFFKDIDYNRKWMVCRHMTCNFWLQRTVLPTSGQQQVINSTAFEPRITYSKHFSKFFINTYSRKQRVLQTYFQ